MNELIKEFARQSGFKVNWQHTDVQTIKMAQYTEFAELIVQECARVAARTECPYTDEILRKEHGHTWDMACVAAGKDIRLHFGVER